MGKLTDLKLKSLKPREKPYKVADGGGLYVLVKPNGSKLFRLNYRFQNKQKTLAIGVYPTISLQEAREIALKAKKLLHSGIDPAVGLKKHTSSSLPNFEKVAQEFLQKNSQIWDSEYLSTIKLRLKNYILPKIGNIPINLITTAQITEILDLLVREGKTGTAVKVKLLIGQIFRYAILKNLVNFDPTQALKGYIKHKQKHYPAVTKKEDLAGLLRAFWDYPYSVTVKNALRILVLTFQRPGEVVAMKWEEIDWENACWRFVLSKTKKEHIVPLAHQAIEILRTQREWTKGLNSPFVFPSLNSPKTRHITPESLNAALKRVGIDTKTFHTSHGFRATARSLLHEMFNYPPDVIELQLGHKVPDRLGEAYARGKFLLQRKKMMQDWADFIYSLL